MNGPFQTERPEGRPAPELRRRKDLFLAALVAVSLVAAAAVLWSTRRGPTVTPDSVSYIAAARGLAAGEGLTLPRGPGRRIPFVRWPPLFPIALAGLELAGVGAAEGVEWFNAAMFGGVVALTGLLVRRYTGRRWLALAASGVAAVSPALLEVHASAWSEPLFLVLALGGLLALERYREKGTWGSLGAAAALVCLAFLTRWTGAALVAAGAFVVLVRGGLPMRKRLAVCALFCFLACVPVGMWLVRNVFQAGSATRRTLAFHPFSGYQLREALWCVRRWVLPETLAERLRMRYFLGLVGLFGAVGGLSVWVQKRRGNSDGGSGRPLRVPLAVAAFSVSYAGFVVFSVSWLDASVPLDNRILSPLYVCGLVLAFWLLHSMLLAVEPWRGARLALVGLCLTMAGFLAGEGVGWTAARARDGAGYTSRAWRESETIRGVGRLPAQAVIYTNDPSALYFLARRSALRLPARTDPMSVRPNGRYEEQLSSAARDLAESRGYVVYLDRSKSAFGHLPEEEELRRALGLRLLAECRDGAIYDLPPGRDRVATRPGEMTLLGGVE